MFTAIEIFTQARLSSSDRNYADSDTHLSVIKLGVRISMSRKTGCVTLSSTCMHDEYDDLCQDYINEMLFFGWESGVYLIAAKLMQERIERLTRELEIQIRKGIKGKRASEALAVEISEMQTKLNKLNYVRSKISVQHPELNLCQR